MIDLPAEFLDSIADQLGDDCKEFIDSLSHEQLSSVRYNIAKYNTFSIEDTVAWEPQASFIKERKIFAHDPLWHGGAYYVQESSSMFLGYVLRELSLHEKPCIAIDVCAAPGGKTTHLLQCLHEDSLVIANEIIPKRNAVLRENLLRWGSPNVIITQSETYKLKNLPFQADVVLVDAPCSGEGLWRKQPSAMGEWSSQQVHNCAIRQRNILEDIFCLVKPGGYLLYSTCTYNEFEDEQQVDYIIESGHFESVEIIHPYEEINTRKSPYGYKFFTHHVKGSGFFMSVFRKKSDRGTSSISNFSNKPEKYEIRDISFLEEKIIHPHKFSVLKYEENLYLFPQKYLRELSLLSQCVYIKSMGVEIGKEIGKNKFQYAHAWALCQNINKEKYSFYDCSRQEALDYLRKNDLSIYPAYDEGQYVLVTYESLPLGWAKYIQGRLKNLLPIALRLRDS